MLGIIDKLILEISYRKSAYNDFSTKFGFFSDLSTLSIDNITDKSRHLITCSNPNDLDESMPNELIHFREFIKCIKSAKPSARELLKVIYEKTLKTCFQILS